MEIILGIDRTVIKKASHHLKKGGVIVYPTETSYGIGCLVSSEAAISTVIAIKGFREGKNFIILVDGLTMAEHYGVFSKRAKDVAKKYWPGPVTIVVKAKERMLKSLCSVDNEIALRHSSNDCATNLVKSVGEPIVSTSANSSGKPPCYNVEEYIKNIGHAKLEGVIIIDGGTLKKRLPSTIVRITEKTQEILRQGEVFI